MKVAVVKTGPGVTCPTATAFRSWDSFNHWYFSTKSVRRKARSTCPLPNKTEPTFRKYTRIDTGATAEEVVEAALRARHHDCVVIGAGLREPPELLGLFEKIINLVHRLAPDAAIAFNANPTDTAEAAERWLGRS